MAAEQDVKANSAARSFLFSSETLRKHLVLEGVRFKLKDVKQGGRDNAAWLKLNKIAAGEDPNHEYWVELAEKAADQAKKSITKVGGKGARPYADFLFGYCQERTGAAYISGKNRTFEFASILDHAARKVVALHSWTKRQEAIRDTSIADQRTAEHNLDPEIRKKLEDYCESRASETEALEPYRIRRRAIEGWKETVAMWRKLGSGSPDERIAAVRELQPSLEKFGDAQLFERLAQEDALVVWSDGPEPLQHFVALQQAAHRMAKYKVPAYRPPDPCLHPIYCDFGNSRWTVEYGPQRHAESERTVTLEVWAAEAFQETAFGFQSKRAAAELFSPKDAAPAPRATRLGRAIAGAALVRPAGLYEKKDWNARLQADRRELERLLGRYAGKRPKDLAPEDARGLRWFLTLSADLQNAEATVAHPHADKNRGSLSKLHFARSEGIRLLSVDLGLRVGASCAVWQLVAEHSLQKRCQEVGLTPPGPDDLSFRIQLGKGSEFYRRTAADQWARLDRQFLIRLDGEKDKTRKLTNNEIERLKAVFPDAEIVGLRFEEGLLKVLESARCQLNDHAMLAKVSYYLRNIERQDSKKTLRRLLGRWLSLLRKQTSVVLAQSWPDHGVFRDLSAKPPGRKAEAEVHAEILLHHLESSAASREAWAGDLESRWRAEDAQWPARLRCLREILIPRGEADAKLLRHKGGLSPARIGCLDDLYRLMRAYAFRSEPDDPRKNIPDDEEDKKFAPRLKETYEQLREQRVKQLASRIAEAALGLGREPSPAQKRDRVRPDDPRYARCDVVVLEALDSYQTSEIRTRRENRQLMTWAKGQLKKYLIDACELHGIWLHQVLPHYTSQFDFRTGSAGLRANFVSPQSWKSPAWLKQLESVAQEDSNYANYLRRVDQLFRTEPDHSGVLIPRRGGELFIPCDGERFSALHADLNAAANVGLWALLDPDWAGRWNYVPVTEDGKPVEKYCKGATVFEHKLVLRPWAAPEKIKGSNKGEKPYRNLFRLTPSGALADPTQWLFHDELQKRLREQICGRLMTHLYPKPTDDTPF
jgi:hypothetical protein